MSERDGPMRLGIELASLVSCQYDVPAHPGWLPEDMRSHHHRTLALNYMLSDGRTITLTRGEIQRLIADLAQCDAGPGGWVLAPLKRRSA